MRVSKCLEYTSALGVTLECLLSAEFPFEFSSSTKKFAALQEMDSLIAL